MTSWQSHNASFLQALPLISANFTPSSTVLSSGLPGFTINQNLKPGLRLMLEKGDARGKP